MTDSPSSARRRYARSLAWIVAFTIILVVSAVLALRGRALMERAAIVVLERLPADQRCGRHLGQLATLVQDGALPPDACLAELAERPLAAAVLARVARDVSRPVPTRTSALAALVAAGTGPPGLIDALVTAPATSPEMRRAAYASAVEGRGGMAWVERGTAVALHGLYDRALARLFALGEPGAVGPARQALAASAHRPDPVVLRDIHAGLGIERAELEEAVARHARGQLPLGLPTEWRDAFWRHGCERDCVPLVLDLLAIEARRQGEEGEPAPPTAPGADDALDVLYAADATVGDHVRAELAAVAGWIRAADEARRTARLVAAVLHPQATPPDPVAAASEAGDPHAVLVRGGGTPAATALVATDLALAARVPLSAWATDAGVALQVGARFHELRACEAPRVVQAIGEAWREVPMGGVDAVALVEAAGQALREGDTEAARVRVDAARALWAQAPGVDALDAALLAREGPVPPPAPEPAPRRGRRRSPPAALAPAPEQVGELVGVPASGALLVSRPHFAPRGRRAASPPPDLRAAVRAALVERAERVLALAVEPPDRVRAAWWAAHGGHLDLARLLIAAAGDPGALRAEERVLRSAVLPAVGEPHGPTPGSESAPCVDPFRADPPPAAWAGVEPGSLRHD